jgi:cellobiose-specific phosphotransferase system component IIC
MTWGLIRRPFINVPWTTPPILGHYLVTGGDWRAAAWGVASIAMAMAVYYPFARAAAARRDGAGHDWILNRRAKRSGEVLVLDPKEPS